MEFQLGASTCPKCGDQVSSPIRSMRWPNVYVQTCRNNECLHTVRTVVEVAPEPERPRPVSLPMPVEGPRPPATKSAIEEFERAYEAGETRKAISRTRRQVRAVSRGDGQLRRLGRDA